MKDSKFGSFENQKNRHEPSVKKKWKEPVLLQKNRFFWAREQRFFQFWHPIGRMDMLFDIFSQITTMTDLASWFKSINNISECMEFIVIGKLSLHLKIWNIWWDWVAYNVICVEQTASLPKHSQSICNKHKVESIYWLESLFISWCVMWDFDVLLFHNATTHITHTLHSITISHNTYHDLSSLWPFFSEKVNFHMFVT